MDDGRLEPGQVLAGARARLEVRIYAHVADVRPAAQELDEVGAGTAAEVDDGKRLPGGRELGDPRQAVELRGVAVDKEAVHPAERIDAVRRGRALAGTPALSRLAHARLLEGHPVPPLQAFACGSLRCAQLVFDPNG
jgi:hypothetical protein